MRSATAIETFHAGSRLTNGFERGTEGEDALVCASAFDADASYDNERAAKAK